VGYDSKQLSSISLAVIHNKLNFIIHVDGRLKKIRLNAEEPVKKNICQTSLRMNALNVIRVIVAVTIIAIAGIALLAAASLLIQTVSATAAMNTTNLTRHEGIASSSNNNSNVTLLGNLFYSTQQPIEESVNPINETYIVISYLDNVTLMPPNATAGAVINATERGNFTVTILPNGLSINQGEGLIMTEDGDGQEESATTTFVSLGRVGPDGTGSHTGAVFFSTNSTGQLAFLDNMIGIAQVEISPEGTIVKIWEWKGGTLPSQNEG
jgi:hypothetical protein